MKDLIKKISKITFKGWVEFIFAIILGVFFVSLFVAIWINPKSILLSVQLFFTLVVLLVIYGLIIFHEECKEE